MYIITHRKIFFTFSGLLILGSIVAMSVYGFNFGIDFKGGSILEVSYPLGPEGSVLRPSLESIKPELDKLNLGLYILTPSGEANFILKTRDITPEEKAKIMNIFAISPMSDIGENQVKEERFNSLGPVVGNQLKNKALVAIAVVTLCIVLFITFAFRKVSKPVASWKYGLATIIALAHDVIIPTGVFILWSHFYGGEIDLLFVTALLAILGYSVHDTIVVFDRVRENLHLEARPPSGGFEQVVGKSVTQTFGRSINTSVTIFLALAALYFFGGESTKNFALILLIGVIAGTYSSIFVASPLLITLEKLQKK